MLAETIPLPLQVTLEAKIIQPCFADSDDFGMIGQGGQLRCLRLGKVFVIRMNPNRCVQIRMGFRQRAHAGKVVQIDAHAECVTDLVLAHLLQNLVKIA